MKKIFLLCFLNCTSWNLYGQCPNYQEIIDKKVNFFFNSPSEPDSLGLFALKNQYIKCSYPKDSSYAKVLMLIGRYFSNQKKYELSESYFKQALVIINKGNSSRAHGIKCLSYLADVYRDENQQQKAIDTYNEIIRLGTNVNLSWNFVSHSYRNIANILYRSGDFQKAIDKTILGEKFGRKANDKMAIAQNFRERTKALNALGEKQEAQKIINRAIEMIKKEGISNSLARLYQTKAFILINDNQPQEALKTFLIVAEIFKQLKNYENYSLACIDIGFAYYDPIRDYEKALFYYQKGLKYASSPFSKVQLYDNIGAVYWKQKNFKKAFEYYQKALTTKDFFKFDNTDITTLPTAKDLQIADFKRTFLIILEDKALAWLDYYKFQPNKSHLQNALNTYKTADRMIDIMRWEQTGEQSKLFWRKKTRSIYQNSIETCYLLNKPEEAFYFFEKSRAVMLNDRLKELGAKQLLSPEDQTQESKLQQEVDNARKLVSENKTNNEGNQQKLLNSENAQTAFFKQIELRNPTYYRYKYDTSAVNIKDLQRKLKDQTLVEYFVADSVVYAFVVSANAMKIHQIKSSNYGDISNEILSMMADENALNKQFERYLSLSNQFYKQFVEPLSLPKGRVIVSPDGTIVPFSALSFSVSQAQYLVKDYAFGYTYSAKFLNQEKKNIAPNAFLGIAPVQFRNNQLKLTDSDLSLQRIAEHFSAPQLLLKEKATRKTFLETMGKYQVVQLYTHALANDTTAQLYLADSIIKASELTTKELLPTELVVLSACQTGIGKDAKGEGVFSLSRSFAMLGIPSTLTTLWKVDNQTTYQITELFYQYLDEGLPKDLALQKAQNEYLSQNTLGLTMPNFWAGMVLIGDNSPLEKRNSLIYWILGGLLLGGIGFWWFKRGNWLSAIG